MACVIFILGFFSAVVKQAVCIELKPHKKSQRLSEVFQFALTAEKFWKNIYYNDAYVYYKNAILFIKNSQNKKYHSFFSNIINKHLYLKKFPSEDIKNLQEWINLKDEKDKNYEANIKDISNVSSLTIKIMDEIFDICPRIPKNIIIYRFETREENNIPNFEKNKLY